eukprot:TRINITY_DN8531_c0_g1_i2.p1 TRINITY_DN8531_c0_g1~~TRINITY_DN8531_c0_g1_i2.p1  ORF type:complete len:691 (+),score=93.26 TRINITY_DN8531_c0_g1_i2:23-2074(+)
MWSTGYPAATPQWTPARGTASFPRYPAGHSPVVPYVTAQGVAPTPQAAACSSLQVAWPKAARALPTSPGPCAVCPPQQRHDYVPPAVLSSGQQRSYVPPAIPTQGAGARSYVPPPNNPGSWIPAHVAGNANALSIRSPGPRMPPAPCASSASFQFHAEPPKLSSTWSFVPPAQIQSESNRSYIPPTQVQNRSNASLSIPTNFSFVADPPPAPPPAPDRGLRQPVASSASARPRAGDPSPRPGNRDVGFGAQSRSPSSEQSYPKIPLQRRRLPVEPATSLDQHADLPGNKQCADCGAPDPDWASVNQGSLICIDCAGTHRSLGAHISKVKSTRLDTWKPEELEAFLSKGGNAEVNRRLLETGSPPPPPRGVSRIELDRYIRAKYRSDYTGGSSSSTSRARAPLPRPPGQGNTPSSLAAPVTAITSPLSGSSPSSSRSPVSALSNGTPLAMRHSVSNRMGTTCHQGLVIVEVISVDIGVERAKDLRMLGPLFLSLSMSLSLGPLTAERTSAQRGSEKVSWMPPERRELLWDAEERWLWCRVFDGGDFTGYTQLAGEGRIDLLAMANKSLAEAGSSPGSPGLLGSSQAVEVELFSQNPAQEGTRSDSEGSESLEDSSSLRVNRLSLTSHALSTASLEDPADPANGFSIGMARLQLTIIDMTGMLSSQEKKSLAPERPTDISPHWRS